MSTIFLACAALGALVLVGQLVLGVAGLAHDAPDTDHDGHAADGLYLFSVRALAAGLLFFGLAGLGVMAAGWPAWAALGIAAGAGLAAAVATAALVRALLRFEHGGAVRIDQALGQPATVYLSVPGERQGVGKVTLRLQNRTVELQAITAREGIPTGSPVVVVDVAGPDTVEVVPTPTDGEIFND